MLLFHSGYLLSFLKMFANLGLLSPTFQARVTRNHIIIYFHSAYKQYAARFPFVITNKYLHEASGTLYL